MVRAPVSAGNFWARRDRSAGTGSTADRIAAFRRMRMMVALCFCVVMSALIATAVVAIRSI